MRTNYQDLVNKRHKSDTSHIKLSYITHFYCNQNNIDSVISLLKTYESFPDDIINHVEFIIVDDCSPIYYEIPELKLNFRWLRITDDIHWNQGGARNLGVTYAKSDKIVMIDLDHELPVATFRYLINHKNPGRNLYKIYRIYKQKYAGTCKGHSNLFFMSRARFMRFYGYDEEFSGNYGAEDYSFVKFHRYHGSKQRYLPRNVLAIHRDNLDREHSYHNLVRDLTVNTPIDENKKLECASFGEEYGHSKLFLNFNWKIVAENNIRPIKLPKVRIFWRLIWWYRWLVDY